MTIKIYNTLRRLDMTQLLFAYNTCDDSNYANQILSVINSRIYEGSK